MGVVISHKLGQRKPYIKTNLDSIQKVAEYYQEEAKKLKIPFKIRRISNHELFIDIGGCETLAFEFQSVKMINNKHAKGWDYSWAVLTDDGKKELDPGYEIEKYPDNEILYSAGFTKTQFCENIIEHQWVADLIRSMAGRCLYAEVDDEGEYYHSNNLDDAVKNIKETGKLINNVSGMLTGLGYKEENIIKNETKIN
jgi:hypothetical protein